MIELVIGIFIGLFFRIKFFEGTLLDPKTKLSDEQINSLLDTRARIESHKRKMEKQRENK